jgi:PAS domain S-box-containing protein
MTSDGKSWLKTLPPKIIVLSTVYFVIGILTLAVNSPPVAITAGMALTAILVWGYGVWPGILLGAFAAQAVFHLNVTGFESLLKTLGISALLGSGAVLQAVVGAYLILRFTGFPRSLYQLRKGNTVLLGGPVSCLVGASIGGTALWLGTGTSAPSLIEQWWNGWLADTLGVLIVMPLVSIWLAEKHRITRHMRLLVFLPVGFAVVLTTLAFVDIRSSRNSQIQAEFTRKTQIMAASLANTIESYFDVLYTVKSLFDSSEKVERHEFQMFVQRLFDRHSGIQALEWIPRVTQSQRSFYEAAVRHEGFLKFQITERQDQGQMVPAAQRGEYFPVNYVEPYTGNELALGFDLASNSERLIAINRSRDTGSLTATARLTLVQEHEKQYGVIVFLPVFDLKGEPDTVETRRDALRGFVLGVFRIGEMVASALKAFDPDTVIYALFDHTPPQDKQLLWAHHPKLQSNADELLNRSWETKSTDLQFRSNFNMGGRNWTMVFTPTADYLAPYQSWDLWAILAGGLLFTSILGVLLLTVFGRSTEISEANISLQSEIVERTLAEAKVRENEERYRSLVSNLDTGVVVHAPDTRILLSNYRAQELLGLTEDQMLGKKDIDPAWHFLREDGARLPQDEYPVNVVINQSNSLRNYITGIKNPNSKDIIWVIVNAFPEYDDNNRLKQIVVTFWDYTQLKLAEAALAKRTNDLARTNIELQRQMEERALVENELKKKQQQIAKDLEVAAGIQQSLIPACSPWNRSIRIAWHFEPCEQIGGDIFNFQYTGPNHISFYMLDVCGHGVSSALISTAVSQFLQTNYELSDSASKVVQPETVLNSLNRVFPFERFDSFFTIVYVTVDYVNGRLSYSCAGHPAPILLRADGQLEVLDMHGPVIGASDGRPFRQEDRQLQPGNKIILYTDGVLDHSNPAGEFFAKHRFYEALKKHGDQPVQTLMDSLQTTIKDFAGPAKSGDDLSMMVIEYV